MSQHDHRAHGEHALHAADDHVGAGHDKHAATTRRTPFRNRPIDIITLGLPSSAVPGGASTEILFDRISASHG